MDNQQSSWASSCNWHSEVLRVKVYCTPPPGLGSFQRSDFFANLNVWTTIISNKLSHLVLSEDLGQIFRVNITRLWDPWHWWQYRGSRLWRRGRCSGTGYFTAHWIGEFQRKTHFLWREMDHLITVCLSFYIHQVIVKNPKHLTRSRENKK